MNDEAKIEADEDQIDWVGAPRRTEKYRLGEFCKIIGENRETMRGMVFREEAPIDKNPAPGQTQRTYDGADIVAWWMFRDLRDVGFSAAAASRAIRECGPFQKAAKEVADVLDENDLFEFHMVHRDRLAIQVFITLWSLGETPWIDLYRERV